MLPSTPHPARIRLASLLLLTAPAIAGAQTLTVTARQPARHALAAPIAGNVTLTFSQAPAPATLARLAVHAGLSGKKAGTYASNGPLLTFDPTTDFKPGETVTVTVPATLQAPGGSGAVPQTYQFLAAVGGPGRGNFTGGGSLPNPGPGGPGGVAVGDVDADGDLDLLSTNRAGNAVSVRLNGGDATGSNTGAFGAIRSVAVGLAPVALALGDVDADGDLDLVTANRAANSVSVRLNDGAGNFSGGQDVLVGTTPVGVVLGDVDADGDLDLVTANRAASTLSVRLNGGNALGGGVGSFSAGQDLNTGGTNLSALALGDADNDGDLDVFMVADSHVLIPGYGALIVAFNGASPNAILGEFGISRVSAVGLAPVALALGDIDADGDLDAVTANGGTVSVRVNGAPGFGLGMFSGTQEVNVGSAASALALADVDADGDLDLVATDATVATSQTTSTAYTRLNGGNHAGNGSGIFSGGTATTVGPQPSALVLGDLDGDLDLDLVTVNAGDATASVRPNQPPPPTLSSFSPSQAPAGTTVTITGTDLAGATLSVGGVAATVLGSTATSLTFVVPAGASPTAPVVATNAFGNGSSTAFTVLLRVTSTSPAPNALNVARTASGVQATLTEALAPAAAGSLRVFSTQAGGRKAGTLSSQAATISFTAPTGTPYTDFRPGEVVSASLTPTVHSAGGIGATGHVWQFTAAAAGSGRANFRHGSDPVAYARPYCAATADLDGDGDLDIITGDYGTSATNGTVSVLPNNGNGTFGMPSSVVISSQGSGGVVLTTGDIDADGDIDAVVASPANASTGLLFNNGRGALSFNVGPGVISSISALTLADIDADGDLDLLTAGGLVGVAFNNGQGFFTNPTTLNLGTAARGITTADVDGDGDLDLLVALLATNTVAVRLNNGQGSFSGSLNVPVGTSPYGVAAADVNGDGNADFLTPNYGFSGSGTTASVRLGDGHGNFTNAPDVTVGLAPSSITTADVDADGDLDLLTTSERGNTVAVRLNNGQGTFSGGSDPVVDTNTFSGAGTLSLATGDLDGDGDIDFVTPNTGNTTGYTVSVRLNQPEAPALLSFSPTSGSGGTVVTITGTGFTNASAVAFNGQPAASFTVVSATQLTATAPTGVTTGPLSVVTPAGTATSAQPFTVTGAFTVTTLLPTRNQRNAPPATPVSFGFNQPLSSSAATLGALSVASKWVSGHRAGSTAVSGNTLTFTPATPFKPGETLQATLAASVQSAGGGTLAAGQVLQFTTAAGPGTGNFPPLTQVATTAANPFDLAAADMNNDGYLDLVSLNVGGNSVSIRFNDGRGQFSGSTNVSVLANSTSLALADVDHDGDLDLLTVRGGAGGSSSNQVSVKLNLGAGTTFSTNFNVSVGTYAYQLITADVNADGYADILTTNGVSGSFSVCLNNRAGGFAASTEYPVGTGQIFTAPGGIDVADVDLDGDLDVVTANGSPNSLSVRLNNGNGGFSGNFELAVPSGPTCLRLADVNGDGIQDALTCTTGNAVLVFFGDGAGGFTNGTSVAVGLRPRFLALGDIDGDGDLDLATTDSDGYTVSVRVNNGRGQFSGTLTLATGQNPMGVVLADFDGDTDLDLAMGSYTNATLHLSLNPGGVTSTRPTALARLVQLYPNPARQHFRLELPALPAPTPLTLTLRNSLGQLVRQQTLPTTAAGTTIDVDATTLPPGAYTLQGHAGPLVFTKTVMLE